MYRIEKTDYGFKLTFAGLMSVEEMKRWADESGQALKGQRAGFQVLVDMRELKPLSSETQTVMVKGQQQYKQAGMERSAVILSSAILAMQFTRLAKESGIYEWERYVDASNHPDWESLALGWLKNKQDPDKK